METSALNVAHEKQRRGEALFREGRFEEAAKCHETVASLLEEAQARLGGNIDRADSSKLSERGFPSPAASPPTSLTLESLALQRDYHKRQVAVVRMKQVEYEEYKANLERQQQELLRKQTRKQSERGCSMEQTTEKFDSSLRQAIYKTIEEQDSLLSMISCPESEDQAFKHPKDPGVVVEELRTINSHLRRLVGSLLSQLEAKEEEVRKLTEKLNAGTVPTDEIRTDDLPPLPPLRLAPLPPLTPLEMPLFDFTPPLKQNYH